MTSLQSSSYDDLSGLLMALTSFYRLYLEISRFFIKGSKGLSSFHNMYMNDKPPYTFKEIAEQLVSFFEKGADTLNFEKVSELQPKCSPGVILSFFSSIPVFMKYLVKYFKQPAVQLHIIIDERFAFWMPFFVENESVKIDKVKLDAYIRKLHVMFQSDFSNDPGKMDSEEGFDIISTAVNAPVISIALDSAIKTLHLILDGKDTVRHYQFSFQYLEKMEKFSNEYVNVSNSKLESSFSAVRDVVGIRRSSLEQNKMITYLRIKSYLTATNGDNVFILTKKDGNESFQSTLPLSFLSSSTSSNISECLGTTTQILDSNRPQEQAETEIYGPEIENILNGIEASDNVILFGEEQDDCGYP
ncbi:hypothetical protein DASC09_014500 [Saccharomycopsis crataegensis]|uniref:Uncharacterized protein n=1 Tax=Saccharomycopsis crataegensis TaxID=43959 RepID=A0AAV5QI09_9ASCO|nr:hypothetical protein DASC09_014500 [Saccharomycopsis crataegensis]